MPDPAAPATPATPPTAAAPAVTAPPVPSPAAPVAAQPAASSTPAAAPAAKPGAAAPSAEKAAEAAKPNEAKTEFVREPSLVDEDPEAEAAPAKPEEAKPAAEGAAPEKYELKLPEGVTLDPERQAQFEGIAREYGLTNEKAQRLLDQHLQEIQNVSRGLYDKWNETQKMWKNEITNDKEIGGANFKQSKAHVARFINSLPEPMRQPFREALNFTGAGNNPAVFRALRAAGQRYAEGTPVKGSPMTATAPKSAASVMYPTHSKG